MISTLTGLFNNGIFQVLLLLLIFAGVALFASFLRKWLWPASVEPVKVDPKKAVKEELDRVLVPLEKPLEPKDKPVTVAKKSVTTTNKTTKKTTKGNASRRKPSAS